MRQNLMCQLTRSRNLERLNEYVEELQPWTQAISDLINDLKNQLANCPFSNEFPLQQGRGGQSH